MLETENLTDTTSSNVQLPWKMYRLGKFRRVNPDRSMHVVTFGRLPGAGDDHAVVHGWSLFPLGFSLCLPVLPHDHCCLYSFLNLKKHSR